MHTHYTRWQSKIVAQAMQTRRVLLLAGARQCGKTTLTRALQTPDVTIQHHSPKSHLWRIEDENASEKCSHSPLCGALSD